MAHVLPLVVIAAGPLGCSTSYDAGSSPDEQLCNLLAAPLAVTKPAENFLLEPALEGGAKDPSDLPSELLAINLAYRTNQDAYDLLGPYEPAIQFAAELVDLAQRELIGPSTLAPKVLRSAIAIDRAIEKDACA